MKQRPNNSDLCPQCGEPWVVLNTKRSAGHLTQYVGCRACKIRPARNKLSWSVDKLPFGDTSHHDLCNRSDAAETQGELEQEQAMIAATKPLTVQQVAERYNVGTRTVLRWVECGEYPKPFTVGRISRWTLEAIVEWEREQSAAPQQGR